MELEYGTGICLKYVYLFLHMLTVVVQVAAGAAGGPGGGPRAHSPEPHAARHQVKEE